MQSLTGLRLGRRLSVCVGGGDLVGGNSWEKRGGVGVA